MGTGESCCKKEAEPEKEVIQSAPEPAEPVAGPDYDQKNEKSPADLRLDVSPECVRLHISDPDLNIDPALLRGITLQRSLRHFGRVWRTAPNKLEQKDHRFLARTVTQVAEFDVFLSHTWETSGKWKTWALLLHTGWPCSLILWFLCSVLVAVVWATTSLLPYTYFYALTYNFEGWVPYGWWMRIGGAFGLLLGLVAAPYCCGSPVAFIDVASINQEDPHLTELGVYGLAGFLSKSKELRVLWSPPLFSRLWCVFELAAFHKANPRGHVVLAPLYVETIFGIMLFGLLGLMFTFMVLHVTIFSGGMGALESVVQMVPVLLLVHYCRRVLREKHRLVAELRHFDVGKARCRNDFDRHFIYQRISEWYGSPEAFTDYVRGPLFHACAGGLSGTRVPLGYWALVGAVEVSSAAEFQLAYYGGGAPWDTLISQFLASVLASVLWRLVGLKLALWLCDKFSSSGSNLCIDLSKTVMIWFLTCSFLFASFQLNHVAEGGGVATSALNAAAAVGVTLLVGRPGNCAKHGPAPKQQQKLG